MSVVWCIFLYVGASCFSVTVCLRQIDFEIPQQVYVGDDVKLRCNFDIKNDTQYEIRWFKGHQIFYHYNTRTTPPYRYFPVIGVNVDVERSEISTIYLKNVDEESEGYYRCNIIRLPPLGIIYIQRRLTVRDFPILSFRQIGFEIPQEEYAGGDDVKLSCNFDLEDDTLYSIQWLKDHQEFSFYVASNKPFYWYSPVTGVNVDFERSGNGTIFLKDVDKKSEGYYNCRVTTTPPVRMIYGEGILTVNESPNLAVPMIVLKLPQEVYAGDNVKLTCSFNLDDERLDFISWDKDGQEFYRYAPSDTPPHQFYPVKGVYLDVERSGNGTIYLKDVDKESEGSYSCSFIAYPLYREFHSKRMLTVKDIAMPQSDNVQRPYHSLLATILMLIVLWIM